MGELFSSVSPVLLPLLGVSILSGIGIGGTILLVFLLVVAASIAAALIGLAIGDVGRAVLSWIFNALTQPVAALTTSVLYFTLLQVRGAAETPQA